MLTVMIMMMVWLMIIILTHNPDKCKGQVENDGRDHDDHDDEGEEE